MQFFGFDTFAEARPTLVVALRDEGNMTPGIREGWITPDEFMERLRTETQTVRPTRSKLVAGAICEGSIDGIYIYSDGSKDRGEVVYHITFKFPILQVTVKFTSLKSGSGSFHD